MAKREKDRELWRRQRRVITIRKLKAKIAETKDARQRERLIEKIKKHSVDIAKDLAGIE